MADELKEQEEELLGSKANGHSAAMASGMELPLGTESPASESSAAESDVTASSSMDTRGPVAPEPERSSRRDNGDRKRNPRQPSKLQRQIERQRNMSRQQAPITSPPSSSVTLMPLNRLVVPERNGDYRQDPQTLVGWDSGDESTDEFDLSASRSKKVQNDVRQQLLKDGYRLDEMSDDDDLDLIPPRAQPSSWIPCQPVCSESCSIM